MPTSYPNHITPDSGRSSHDAPSSTISKEIVQPQNAGSAHPPMTTMPGYWKGGSMVVDDPPVPPKENRPHATSNMPSSPTVKESPKRPTTLPDNTPSNSHRTIPGQFGDSMYISLDDSAFVTSKQTSDQSHEVTPTPSLRRIDHTTTTPLPGAKNGHGKGRTRFTIPELLTSDPTPNALSSDASKQPPLFIRIPPKNDRLFSTDRRRGDGLKRSHPESEDDIDSKVRVVIPSAEKLHALEETIRGLLGEKSNFQAKYDDLKHSHCEVLDALSVEKAALQRKAHESSQELEQANLKSEALKRIVDEKDEVQSKLNETSERVEQLLKEKECLKNSVEMLSKLNERFQAGVMERSDEALVEQEMKQELLEEKVVEISEANEKFKSQLEEMIQDLAAKDDKLAQLLQEKTGIEVTFQEEMKRVHQSNLEHTEAFDDLSRHKDDLELRLNEELQAKQELEAKLKEVLMEKETSNEELSNILRTQQREHEDTLRKANDNMREDKEAAEELLRAKDALEQSLGEQLRKATDEIKEKKDMIEELSCAKNAHEESLNEQLRKAHNEINEERKAVEELSRAKSALEQSFEDQRNNLVQELKDVSRDKGLLEFELRAQVQRVEEAISEKEETLSKFMIERQDLELKLIQLQNAKDSSPEHAVALNELLRAKEAMEAKLTSQIQQEQRSLSEMTREKDDLQSRIQHMISCTESMQVQELAAAKDNILAQLSEEKEAVESARQDLLTSQNLYHDQLQASKAEANKLLDAQTSLENISRDKDILQLRLDTELKQMNESLFTKENLVTKLRNEKASLIEKESRIKQKLLEAEANTRNLVDAKTELERQIEKAQQDQAEQIRISTEELAEQERHWKAAATEFGFDTRVTHANTLRECVQHLRDEQSRGARLEEELKYSDAKLKQSDANLKHSDAERKRAQDAKVALEVNVRATREAYEKQLQEARDELQRMKASARNTGMRGSSKPQTSGGTEPMDVDENLSERVRSKRPMRSTTPKQQANQNFKKRHIRFRLGLPDGSDDDGDDDDDVEHISPPNKYRTTRNSRGSPSIAQRIRNAYPSPGYSPATHNPSNRFSTQSAESPTGTGRGGSPFVSRAESATSSGGAGPSSSSRSRTESSAPRPPGFSEDPPLPDGSGPLPSNGPKFRETSPPLNAPQFRNDSPPLNGPGFRYESARDPDAPQSNTPGFSQQSNNAPTTPTATSHPSATSGPSQSIPSTTPHPPTTQKSSYFAQPSYPSTNSFATPHPSTTPNPSGFSQHSHRNTNPFTTPHPSATPNPSGFSQPFSPNTNPFATPHPSMPSPSGFSQHSYTTPRPSATPGPSQAPSSAPNDIPGLESIKSSIDELRNNIRSVQEQLEDRSMPHTPTSRKQKVNPGSRARSVARTNLMTALRKEMNRRWCIQQDAEIPNAISRGFFTELNVANDYEKGLNDGPVLSRLSPCWETPKCLWNRELARLFARDFVRREPTYNGDMESIVDYFISRIITLKKILGLVVSQEGETDVDRTNRLEEKRDQRLASGRRYQRLTQLFNRRSQICLQKYDGGRNEKWGLLGDIVDRLGVDGQSSDDSDGGEFTVSYLEWRSDHVTQLLDFCDENRTLTTETGTRRPGVMPRERIREDNPRPSRRGPKCGLPINFYNELWFASLGTTAREDVDAQPEIPLLKLVTQRR